MASDPKAKVTITNKDQGIRVDGYEHISYDFSFIEDNGIFNPTNPALANLYLCWGRCLAITDLNVASMYGNAMQRYFDHYGITLTMFKAKIGEKAKTVDTMLSICTAMNGFGIYRKEPVLVVGGGLITDVAGYACASYRRNTNYVRIPTTLIGLIDASVSIKVAVNYEGHKNRLGAYHAPMMTFLDFGFLKTLPTAQVRNGFAELIKISTCADNLVFELLDQYCEALISTHFGQLQDHPHWTAQVKEAADIINRGGVITMLKLETPNLHEIGLDRVIAYGHTWSPTLELAPATPLRHGHAISIDMAYSITLAMVLGKVNPVDRERILKLFCRAGLAIDHELFTCELLRKGTEAILKTRDGKLRAAIPNPIGSCIFLNDVSMEIMDAALKVHKEYVAAICPRKGVGIDQYVDASDTGVCEVEQAQKTGNSFTTDGFPLDTEIVDSQKDGIIGSGNGFDIEGKIRTMLSASYGGHPAPD